MLVVSVPETDVRTVAEVRGGLLPERRPVDSRAGSPGLAETSRLRVTSLTGCLVRGWWGEESTVQEDQPVLETPESTAKRAKVREPEFTAPSFTDSDVTLTPFP